MAPEERRRGMAAGPCPQVRTWPWPAHPAVRRHTSSGPPGGSYPLTLVHSLIFILPRSLSFPDISQGHQRAPATGHTNQTRHINMMILNPRASKIRYMNASHSLLIDLEKHVQRVQQLEGKVVEMENELRAREMAKAQLQAGLAEQSVAKRKVHQVVSEEAKQAFANRLDVAKRKTDEMVAKRDRHEANILRSWHMKKLGRAIDQLSQVPEERMMLPAGSSPVTEKDLVSYGTMLNCLEGLVDTIQPTDEVTKLRELLEERDNLRELVGELEAKDGHIDGTVKECKVALHNINAARIKVCANLKMAEKLLNTMQNLEQTRKNMDLFVFGPNPIFSSTKTIELNYSISNQSVIEMLKELDISQLLVMKSLQSAKGVQAKHRKNQAEIQVNLNSVQENIDIQIELVNAMQMDDKVKAIRPDAPIEQPNNPEPQTQETKEMGKNI